MYVCIFVAHFLVPSCDLSAWHSYVDRNGIYMFHFTCSIYFAQQGELTCDDPALGSFPAPSKRHTLYPAGCSHPERRMIGCVLQCAKKCNCSIFDAWEAFYALLSQQIHIPTINMIFIFTSRMCVLTSDSISYVAVWFENRYMGEPFRPFRQLPIFFTWNVPNFCCKHQNVPLLSTKCIHTVTQEQ